MNTATTAPTRSRMSARERRSRRGTPTWEIARFFPDQGEWSESDYLDLVIEIVSEGQEHRDRDLIEKRKDYAAGRIPEYWIVDPEMQTITVLTLKRSGYRVHGEFRAGQLATSLLLPDFKVDVGACFKAARKS
jgi:Uma2 family endonuclease